MRVISGTYGGRFLEKVPSKGTRPTNDKVKESLFNIIGPYFKGGKVLDLYAGSGALGIEAVSRGMDEAVLVDSSKLAIQTIKKNIKITNETNKFKIIHEKADTVLDDLGRTNEKFTLIFLDPPFADEVVQKNVEQLIGKDLLADISVIVCEVASKVDLPDTIQSIPKWEERKFGNKKLVIYQKIKN